MESAMLYNLPMLYGLYAIVAGFHCAFPGHYYLPFLGTLPMLLWSDVSLPILLLLLLVGNSIHFLLITLLHALSFRLVLRSWRLESMIFMLLGILAPLTIGCLLWNDAWSIRGLASCIIYGAGIVAMMLACLWLVGQSSNRVPFVALVLIATPGILAGSIALMLWEQNVDTRSWWIWARLIIPVFGVCRYGKSTACSSHNATTRALLVLLAVLGTGRNLVMMGNSFRVGHLVFAVSLVEVCLQVRHEHVRESKKEFQHAD